MEENTRRMIAGQLYNSHTAELTRMLLAGHRLCFAYNRTAEDDHLLRNALLDQLLGSHGKHPQMAAPIYFDLGCLTTVGDDFGAGPRLTVLDECPITIGSRVTLGPGVSLYAGGHPLRYQERNNRIVNGKEVVYEIASPITIGDDCQLGANVVVVGGVTIGAGSVIAPGTVVTKDIPPHSYVAGNPGRVVEQLP